MNDPKTGSAPHDCPNCGAPSYVGGPGMPTQCTSRECPFYSEDCWVLHVMELPDEDTEPGQYLDIEDEDTQPYLKMPSLFDLYANNGGLAAWLPDPNKLTPKQQKALYANKGVGMAPYSPGSEPARLHDSKQLTPKQQKAVDTLDAAIDKMPVPYFKKPLDND